MPSLQSLYKDLTQDLWRKDHAFSSDVEKVHGVIFDSWRTEAQREEAYLLWMQKNQPCLFGRIAAASQRLHFCILDEEILRGSDKKISEKIEYERTEWKRRSLRPDPTFSHPAHGFILTAISPRLASAAPDNNLRRFSEKLLSLWKVSAKDEPQGKVHSECLYLQNPKSGGYVRFQFSVDFFMAQGDGRWWCDHRIPGGIAFTANSVGHMLKYREWYEKLRKQEEWILQTAMLTIDAAQETEFGKATWLKPLLKGKPIVKDLKCPFSNPRKELEAKDWTRYGGHLHTDLAIRDEFFSTSPDKGPDITDGEYVQDFAYLTDKRQRDHQLFIQGQNVSEQEVFDEIGDPEDYVRVSVKRPKLRKNPTPEFTAGVAEVERKLDELRVWKLDETK